MTHSGCLGYPINFKILLNSTIIFLLGIGASFVASLTHLHVAQYRMFHRNGDRFDFPYPFPFL